MILAVLFVVSMIGVASAVNIPKIEDPTNGPAIWLLPVYNNETSTTIDAGDVAVWDIGNSTGDNDNYVIQSTAADTFLVAGIVYPVDIVAKSDGFLAIKGVVTVDVGAGNSVGTNSLLCSSAVAGAANTCSDSASDPNAFGFSVAATSAGGAAGTVTAYIFGR